MSNLTVKLQRVSWSQAILNPILADILSFSVANVLLSEKNSDLVTDIFRNVEE